MSHRLLMLLSSKTQPRIINYKPSDDLESLFYIFLEITTQYGRFGQISNEGQPPEDAATWRSVYEDLRDPRGFSSSGALKRGFLEGERLYKLTLFFQNCSTIVDSWCDKLDVAIRERRDVSHGDIHEVIIKGLSDLERSSPIAAPSLPPPTSLHSSANTLPLTVPSVTSDSNELPPSASGSTGRITQSMQKNQMLLPEIPNVSLPPLPSSSMAEVPDNGSRRGKRKLRQGKRN